MRSFVFIALATAATVVVALQSGAQDCAIQAFGTVTQAKEHILAGDRAGAKNLLERAHEQCPTSARVARAIGQTYEMMGDDSNAGYYWNLANTLEGKPQVQIEPASSDTISSAAKPALTSGAGPFVLKPLSDVDQFVLSVPPVPPNPKRWAIVIGIDNYSTPGITPTTFSGQDAAAAWNYFVRVLGVPERQAIRLMDENATKAGVEKWLKRDLPNQIKYYGGADQVYFYFSGHGSHSGEDNYLLPFDGDPSWLKGSGISVRDLYDDLSALGAKSEIAFLDACFTGNNVVQGAKAMSWDSPPASSAPASVIAFAAAAKNQEANVYQAMNHSLFTYFLLKSLQQKNVDISTLSSQVTREVEEKAGELWGNPLAQTPELLMGSESDKNLILVRR